jgi:hypothetical protein
MLTSHTRKRDWINGGLLAFAVTAGSLLIPAHVVAQSSSSGGTSEKSTTAKPAAATTAAKVTTTENGWKVPRTADGHPSFEGVWANNWVTPTQRPAQWAGKQTLSDAELEQFKKLLAQVDPGGDALFGDDVIQAAFTRKQVSYDSTGNYNQFWNADREIDNRTSLITDPPDGRIPPLTAEAQSRLKDVPARNNLIVKADGPEDRTLHERCITFGVPRAAAGYDSYFQFVQSPNTIAIMQETIHEVRLIPIGTSPHVPPAVRQWTGDPRGHWEGDTLVVDTTNYSPDTDLNSATENLHVIERFTRVSPDYINWEITWIDPTTWTKPWTEMIRLRRSDEQLYEYACHEGNYALPGILAGARAQEKAAADAVAKKTQ